MIREADLDKALMRQKELILDQLWKCETAADYQSFLTTLGLVLPVWHAVDYSYKGKEILKLVIECLQESALKSSEARDTAGRMRKLRKQWDTEYDKLIGLINTACCMAQEVRYGD
jgi:hypothetical protein